MRTIAVLAALLSLPACSLPVFFRVPVVQGNIVTAKQVGTLDLGMTKKQVRYVLGTPLVNPEFEQDRWDYVFYYRNPRAKVRESKVSLYFVDDELADVQGDEEYTAQILEDTRDNTLSGAPPPGSVSPGARIAPAAGASNADTGDSIRPATAPAAGDSGLPGDTGPNSAGSAAPVVPPQNAPNPTPGTRNNPIPGN